MQLLKKISPYWAIFILSLLGFFLYTQLRESAFPIPQASFRLDQKLSDNEIRSFIEPFVDFLPTDLKYNIDTFVDRNSVKFLQKTLSDEDFQNILKSENLPLWGWTIHIDKPFQGQIKISHQHKLIGFESTSENPGGMSNFQQTLKSIEKKTSKDFSTYNKSDFINTGNKLDLHFEKKTPKTNLFETINITFDKGNLTKFESKLLLPTSYANAANIEIEKQKTLHQFFNFFHYILIALVFLFLFRMYEVNLLSWKKNLPVYLALFFSYFLNDILTSSESMGWFLIFQSFMETVGSTAWMFALIVASDCIAKSFNKSAYSISDLTNFSFYTSGIFRKSLSSGWILFATQLVFVGLFYKFFSHFSGYVPFKIPGEHSHHNTFEFLHYFFDSFSTAIFEEILYRVFLISFFTLIFKKPWPGIILSALLWGFLHFSYQFEPYYIRGLELSLVGILYGIIFVRYGILSVIFAHFFYNSFILSEYEYQSTLYLFSIGLSCLTLFSVSYLFKSKSLFFFEKIKLPEFFEISQAPPSERRNLSKTSYPLNWKYGVVMLAAVTFILLSFSIPQNEVNPLVNKNQLLSISSKIVSSYNQNETWNISYNKPNSNLPSKPFNYSSENEIADLDQYNLLWSIRYFTKIDPQLVCQFDYSYQYELMELICPYSKNTPPKLYEDWIYQIKNPKEHWTLLHSENNENGITNYQYSISQEGETLITKTAFLNFNNGQLTHFKKSISFLEPSIVNTQNENSKVGIETIALSLFFILILIGFFILLLETIKNNSILEKKAIWGAFITCNLYSLWTINSYKEILIEFNNSLTFNHMIFNAINVLCLKILILGFISYLLFYAFIYFPSKTFKYFPTPQEWNGILSRPIWKWRNTKVSLLYATLLLLIQFLLRLLVQVNSGKTILDIYNFDIQYLNHEFIFITFMGLLWKNLMFWISLLVIISILENFIPRKLYLILLIFISIFNTWNSQIDTNSKLIELCGTYIVFYFIYNIARFDFAFYFWFILLNTVMTFFPVIFHEYYSVYLYQVAFIFIFVFALIFFTLFHKKYSKDFNYK